MSHGFAKITYIAAIYIKCPDTVLETCIGVPVLIV